MTKKKKSKPMSAALKRFLKKHGRFPKKGELARPKKKGPKKKSKHHKSQSKKSSPCRKRSRGWIFG